MILSTGTTVWLLQNFVPVFLRWPVRNQLNESPISHSLNETLIYPLQYYPLDSIVGDRKSPRKCDFGGTGRTFRFWFFDVWKVHQNNNTALTVVLRIVMHVYKHQKNKLTFFVQVDSVKTVKWKGHLYFVKWNSHLADVMSSIWAKFSWWFPDFYTFSSK